MHGEVILCSEDVSTVGAVTMVGLSLTKIADLGDIEEWSVKVTGL